ncbi:hypothetical protein C8Q75DRAFT_802617 [Abortiporus biennis]|nr:hypothetical protein C8Q75DRAFT_802617 [Abortiporus biennis]
MSVKVDDRDSSIVYQGTWDQTSDGGAYQGTITSNDGLNVAVLDFSFTGVQVSVHGAVVPVASGESPAISSYTIDEGNISSFYTQPNVTSLKEGLTFYTSDTLSYGKHTMRLVVNVAMENTPFMLDYIAYDPGSPPVTTSPSATAPSTSKTSPQTTTSPTTPTQNTLPSTKPASTGGTSNSSQTGTSTNPQQTGNVSQTSTNGSGVQSSNPTATSNLGASATNPSGSQAGAASTSGMPNATASGTNSPVSLAAKHSAPAGPIAGGVVGGIFFLALLALFAFLWKRRQHRKNFPEGAAMVPYYQDEDQPPPFEPNEKRALQANMSSSTQAFSNERLLNPSMVQLSQSGTGSQHESGSSSSGSHTTPSGHPDVGMAEAGFISGLASASTLPSQQPSPDGPAADGRRRRLPQPMGAPLPASSNGMNRRTPVQHQDSGVRFRPGEDVPVPIPPVEVIVPDIQPPAYGS